MYAAACGEELVLEAACPCGPREGRQVTQMREEKREIAGFLACRAMPTITQPGPLLRGRDEKDHLDDVGVS
jgi:hypothetical protein